jgi:hypothetical protein
MSKFLLNLLVQISKALVYSKIKFYSEKNFFRRFRPIRPFGPAAAHSLFSSLQPAAPHLPTGPRPLSQPISPSRPGQPRAGGALLDCRLPHREMPLAASPLPSPCLADRWTPPIIPHLRLCRVRLRHHRLHHLGCRLCHYLPHHHFPPLIPLLNPPPS